MAAAAAGNCMGHGVARGDAIGWEPATALSVLVVDDEPLMLAVIKRKTFMS